MKIVIPGGRGQLGSILARALRERGDEVVVLTRGAPSPPGLVAWDGRSLGAWAREIDGADAVINLAGRSVDCHYDKGNLTDMLASRIDSTRVVGEAITAARRPPGVWLQASTATIYAHTFGGVNDEATGEIGGNEPDVPSYWRYSVEIAKAWERELAAADTPATRRVAMRTSIVMSRTRGGPFAILRRLARLGLGGAIAGGRQSMSWLHERDLVRAVEFLLARDDLDGAVNVTAPNPISQREFMQELRRAVGMPIGLPATRWMVECATKVLRTDSELLLKSRAVVPSRLIAAGFTHDFPSWPQAVADLVARPHAAT